MVKVLTKGKANRILTTILVALVLFCNSSEIRAEVDPSQIPVYAIPTEEFELNELGAQVVEGSGLISAAQFRQACGVNGSGYSLAVIDTGVDYNHPNLGGGWGNRVIAGYDFVNNDGDPMDDNGHGTHVAGIVASNHSTYTGVAPAANIIALKVLGANGSGSFAAVESALQWVIANRATYNIVAINLSLGAGNYTSNPYNFLEDELSTLLAANVQVWAASGNSFYSYSSAPGVGYPAISPQMISVGSVYDANVGQVSFQSGAIDYSTAANRVSSFSQRHPSLLDFMAPGAMITATQRGGGFVALAGTSMAAPIAAAAGLLVRAALDSADNPNINQDDIIGFLASTASVVNDGDDEHDNVSNTGANYLRINLAGLCQQLIGENPTPTPSPTPSATPSPSPSPTSSPSPSPTSSPSPSASPTATVTPTPIASPSPSASPSATPIPTPTPPSVPELVENISREIGVAFKARSPEQLQEAINRINNLINDLIRLLQSLSGEIRSTSSIDNNVKIATTRKLINALRKYNNLIRLDRSPEVRAKLKIARKRIKKHSARLESLG